MIHAQLLACLGDPETLVLSLVTAECHCEIPDKAERLVAHSWGPSQALPPRSVNGVQETFQ